MHSDQWDAPASAGAKAASTCPRSCAIWALVHGRGEGVGATGTGEAVLSATVVLGDVGAR